MPSDAKLAARIEELKKSRSPRPDAGERPVRRRRHAARKSRMAALFLSVISTASLSATFLLMDASAQTQAAFAALPEPITPGEPTTVVVPPLDASSQSSRGASPTQDAPPATAPVQVLAFNGQRADTPYGPVQVQVQVQAETGQLVDVAVVRFPDGDPTSRGINARALPRLRSEALAAQSARIDTVSGATYTTRGYEASLQSAIDAALAANVQSGSSL
jgi:uncharacterized protein with FMN-binding domain